MLSGYWVITNTYFIVGCIIIIIIIGISSMFMVLQLTQINWANWMQIRLNTPSLSHTYSYRNLSLQNDNGEYNLAKGAKGFNTPRKQL